MRYSPNVDHMLNLSQMSIEYFVLGAGLGGAVIGHEAAELMEKTHVKL